MYKSELVDDHGRLSFARNKTKELVSLMFDEIVALFPQIDGFRVRVGEVYLQDAPFHTGVGAVNYRLPYIVRPLLTRRRLVYVVYAYFLVLELE